MPIAKIEKVLIITSSGGGGLLQAANAKEQEIRAKNPNVIVIQRDVMTDWMWKGIGKFFIRQWNDAQINGNVWNQNFFGTMAWFIDYFFWPHIFVCSLYTLFKEDVDRVLDTQVMGTSAVLKAIRLFNRQRNKQIHLEKVLVDLPTIKATHFFLPIKALNKKDRNIFKLITVAPLLEKGQTQDEFWVKNCNLTAKELQYEDYYVRKGFWKFKNLQRVAEQIKIRTRYQSKEELGLILKTIDRGTPQFSLQENDELEFTIEPDVQVYTVLLGSQPASEATLNYVKKFIEITRVPAYLFVFCANHQHGQNSLFKRVTQFILEVKDYPKNLTIIPMSFQQDDILGPLFFRSDIMCTRSGGQTAMELMCATRGKIWIHSESKKINPTEDEYLKGIPAWESANAVYLQHVKNAKIVTPASVTLESINQ